MRKWRLFEITNNVSDSHVTISSIQNATGYNSVRQTLSKQYSTTSHQANIQIVNANLKGNRELKLKYTSVNNEALNNHTATVLQHIEFLWGYPVSIAQA